MSDALELGSIVHILAFDRPCEVAVVRNVWPREYGDMAGVNAQTGDGVWTYSVPASYLHRAEDCTLAW